MNRIGYFAALIIVALCCTGCWPEHITSSPAAEGMVIDAKTREAVCGAHVQMSYVWRAYWSDINPPALSDVITNVRPPLVMTDTNGDFAIPREHVWVIMYPLPEWETHGSLIILKDGYEPAIIPVSNVHNADLQGQTYELTPVPGK
jgi:hypothetical protein